jgi:hypothetical protein
MRIVIALCVTAVLCSPSLADSPAGTYYVPAGEDHKEMLLIIREGGVFQMSVIVKDGRETYQGNWSRKGNELSIMYSAEIRDCRGKSIQAETFVQSFTSGSDGLILSRTNVKRLFYRATPEQVKKVLDISRCN